MLQIFVVIVFLVEEEYLAYKSTERQCGRDTSQLKGIC